MDNIGSFEPTGRRLVGPASDLVECTSANGLRHTAIMFHEEFRDHNAINAALDVVEGFLESTMVTGLVDLKEHGEGYFVYATGQCWSVAEVIRVLADHGITGGVRAGLELMYAAGTILIDAAESGESQGVYSHGGLTPWRVMLKKDGQVMIIGHALPQVEILQFHEDERLVPREDSFRYCPPERIEAAPEDVSSDLFSLTLIAFELMTGRPVYDGLVNDIRQQAARGEGSRRLFGFRDVLPDNVRNLMSDALRPDMDNRHEDGEAFLEAVRKVLTSGNIPGESLMDLMSRMSVQRKRTGEALQGGKTMMLTREQLLKMAEEGDSEDDTEREQKAGAEKGRHTMSLKPEGAEDRRRRGRRPRRGAEPEPEEVEEVEEPEEEEVQPAKSMRWSKVSSNRRRPRRSRLSSEPEPEPEEEELPRVRHSRRVSQGREEPEEEVPSLGRRVSPGREEPEPEPEEEEPLQRRSRRVRRSSDGDEDDGGEVPFPEHRRVRRSGSPAGEEPGDAGPVGGDEDEDEDAKPRFSRGRRPRRSREEGDEVPPAEPLAAAERRPPAGDAAGEPRSRREPVEASPAPPLPVELPPKPEQTQPPPPPPELPEPEPPAASLPDEAPTRVSGSAKDLLAAIRESTSRPMPRDELRRRRAEADEGDGEDVEDDRRRARLESRKSAASVIDSILKGSTRAPIARRTRLGVEPEPVAGPAPQPAIAPASAPAPVAPPPQVEDAVDPDEEAALRALLEADLEEVDGDPTGETPEEISPEVPDPPTQARSVPAPRPSAGTASWTLRAPAGPTQVVLPTDITAAAAVMRLTGSELPLPVDLTGSSTGWFRLVVDGERLDGNAPLPVGATLDLDFVENEVVRVQVEGGGVPPLKFACPMGTAVPVGGLVAYLVSWLGLPGLGWRLVAGGRALGEGEILADLGALPDVIQLQRGGG